MASPALSFPFAHWDTRSLRPPLTAAITASFLHAPTRTLTVGLSSGELCVFAYPPPHDEPLQLLARLAGHHAFIVALASYTTVSENSAAEPLLLSLSADASLSKWSLRDFRCLQSAPVTPDGAARALPHGMVVVRDWSGGESRLTQSLVLVYGGSTEIAVLNAESLETVLLWRGHDDWPIPLAYGPDGGRGFRETLVMTPAGRVQGWKLSRTQAGMLSAAKTEYVDGKAEEKSMGKVLLFARTPGAYTVVYERGVIYYITSEQTNGLAERDRWTIKGEDGKIVRAGMMGDGLHVWVQCATGSVRIFSPTGTVDEIGSFQLPSESQEQDRVVNVTCEVDYSSRSGSVVFFTQSRSLQTCSTLCGSNVSIARFTLPKDRGPATDIQWAEKVLANPGRPENLSMTPAPSASSTFLHMYAAAYGSEVRLYTIPAFLLFHDAPASTVSVPCGDHSIICLLQHVRVSEYVGSISSGSNSLRGGTSHLIAGTTTGSIFIISSSLHSSARLSLFPNAVVSAHMLPSYLGRRLRSTLLATSADGTAAIVDLERARAMVTFPSHDYAALSAFAVLPGRNLVRLIYNDGVRRDWEMGEENGGVLKAPPSRGSADSEGSDERLSTEEGAWEVVYLRPGEEHPRGEPGPDDAEEPEALRDCRGFSGAGLPAAAVDVRVVLEALERATERAEKRSNPNERRVLDNNPALVNTRALLTALVPGGVSQMIPAEDGGDTGEEEEEGDWRAALAGCFVRRARPATLGQLGAGGRISLLTPAYVRQESISPTLTTIVLLTALVLVSEILQAVGKKHAVSTVLERVLRAHIGRREVALGVLAKFGSDGNEVIRWAARESMDAFMSGLNDSERVALVEHWKEYLPVCVPPELGVAKEVVRSVMVLGKLVADYDAQCDESLKKSTALSAALLLSASSEVYQDTAVEVIGYAWLVFQAHFDPYAVIYTLILLSINLPPTSPRRANLDRCILSIAQRNTPLLITALSNSISHGSPTSTPTASLAASTLQTLANTSTSAMALAGTVIRADAVLLADVLQPLLEAVVRTLDPNGGLRDRVLPAVTQLVTATVAAYPTAAFHRPTQRLALAVPAADPPRVVVWDLKSAATAHVCEGHASLAAAVEFSADGKYLAAAEAEAGRCWVWRFPTGVWGFVGSVTGEGERGLQPRGSWPFTNPRAWGHVQVKWAKERTVEVRAGEEVSRFEV